MNGAASVAESYFNASGAASEQFARLERKNAELKKREAKLESDNAELSQRLKERETMKTSPRSWVDVVNLRKAQTESALEAKAHELAQIAERISSLEAAMAQREVQVLNIRAKVQTVLNETAEATQLADLACTHNGSCVLTCQISCVFLFLMLSV